jgi:hypothetical protein
MRDVDIILKYELNRKSRLRFETWRDEHEGFAQPDRKHECQQDE